MSMGRLRPRTVHSGSRIQDGGERCQALLTVQQQLAACKGRGVLGNGKVARGDQARRSPT
jgi:hypothetical protein